MTSFLFSQNTKANDSEEFNYNYQNYNLKLQITNQKNEIISQFMVALANNQNKRSYGLMNLKFLPEKYGMLFTFDHPQIINMWMKNTLIPLDMIFIDDDNKIVNIKKSNQPNSLTIISSERKSRSVLEINAGLTEKFAIQIGDKIKLIK